MLVTTKPERLPMTTETAFAMSYTIGTKTFEVKETNGKYFYYSRLAGRWLPVKKSAVTFR
jgi:hypothetical protein